MAVTEVSKGIYDVTATESAATLIPFESGKGGINSIAICNQHGSTDAVVSLILDDELGSTNDIYIVKGVSIPAGVTLVLKSFFTFNTNVHSLKLTNTGGVPLSIIIR